MLSIVKMEVSWQWHITTSAILKQRVYNDIEVEPQLQQVDNEQFNGLKENNAQPDIRAKAVWRNAQNAYFLVKVTNVNSDSQKNMPVEKILSKYEKEKKGIITRRLWMLNMEPLPHWFFL